jgi:hypothetical protein
MPAADSIEERDASRGRSVRGGCVNPVDVDVSIMTREQRTRSPEYCARLTSRSSAFAVAHAHRRHHERRGVGKSTITANLAVALRSTRTRVSLS